MSEREYGSLRSALASTRMEGFEITEQTEKTASVLRAARCLRKSS